MQRYQHILYNLYHNNDFLPSFGRWYKKNLMTIFCLHFALNQSFYRRIRVTCDPILRCKVNLPKFFSEKCLIFISSFSSSSAKRFRTTRNFWVGFGSFLAKSAMWNSSNSSGPLISICLIKWPNTLKYFFVALFRWILEKLWLGLLQGLNRKNH